MTTDRELMQQALDALEGYARNCRCEGGGAPCDAAEALRARLAQPEQEPVAWRFYEGDVWCYVDHLTDLPQNKFEPLYTAPPQQHSEQWWRHEVSNAWAEGYEKGRANVKQPEQKPVACPYCHYSHTLGAVYFDQNCAGCVKRMTAPPQREWQGLTDEEVRDLWSWSMTAEAERTANTQQHAFARAIEAKLKEKNNG